MADTGSNTTLISERFAKEIGLKGIEYPMQLNGIGAHKNNFMSAVVQFRVRTAQNTYDQIWSQVRVVPNIADDSLKALDWTSYLSTKGINADITPLAQGRIDVLIGTDLVHAQLHREIIEGPTHQDPVAIRTDLGWACAGIPPPNFAGVEYLQNGQKVLFCLQPTAKKRHCSYATVDFSNNSHWMDKYRVNKLTLPPVPPVPSPPSSDDDEGNRGCGTGNTVFLGQCVKILTGEVNQGSPKTVSKKTTTAKPCQNHAEMKAANEVIKMLVALDLQFKMENLGDNVKDTAGMSVDDERCLKLLQDTYKRGERYCSVSPLWRVDQPSGFTTNFQSILEMTTRLWQRLDAKGRDSITKIFDDYLEQGIAREVFPQNPHKEHALYWPHFGVPNPNSDTTPLRPVMDGRRKVINGKSINDHCYLQGPNLLCDLTKVLLRFRLYDYVFAGDISKMFLKINVPDEYRKFQRFLWFKGTVDNLRVLEFLGHVFGNNGSPTCSIYALKRTAEEFRDIYPEAAEAIINSSIVDDILGSADTPEKAAKILNDTIKIVDAMGLKLAKCVTNSELVRKLCPGAKWCRPTERFFKELADEPDLEELPGDEFDKATLRTLGHFWEIEKDRFTYKLYKPQDKVWNKLQCLSQAHTIYDPLGFATPFTIESRLFLQELWKLGYGWKDPLLPEELERWNKWLSEIHRLNELEYQRVLMPGLQKDVKDIQLHVFADASNRAYAAVAYCRVEYTSKPGVYTNYVMAKAKVNPIKDKRTIPKLELMGIHLAAKLAYHVAEPLGMMKDGKPTTDKIYLWSDSKTALQWLHMDPRSLQLLCHNYVIKIKDLVPLEQIRFVPGDQNPADLPTRPRSIDDVTTTLSWREGPKFLRQSREHWPDFPIDSGLGKDLSKIATEDKEAVLAEVKKEFRLTTTMLAKVKDAEDGELDTEIGPDGTITKDWFLAKHYRSYEHHQRTQALVIMYVRKIRTRIAARNAGEYVPKLINTHGCKFGSYRSWFSPVLFYMDSKGIGKPLPEDKRPKIPKTLQLEVHACDDAEATIRMVWYHQRICFGKTIALLESKKGLTMSNKLHRLDPVLMLELDDSLASRPKTYNLQEPLKILRLSGRLKKSEVVSYEQKHPYLLYPETDFTNSVIRHYHNVKLNHMGGIKCLKCELQRTMWIAGTLAQLKRQLRLCTKCRRYSSKPTLQQMGYLPDFRIPTQERLVPFETVCIDMAGPFYISQGARRSKLKRFIIVFRCAVTGAIHLEVVDQADTDSFLMAMVRFNSEQTTPKRILSDNGGNFTGGNKEIKLMWDGIKLDQVQRGLKAKGWPALEWSWAPPMGPHHNGLAEISVQAAKRALKPLMNNGMRDEEFRTLVKEVQMYLNNRPLAWEGKQDADDPSPITPAHLMAKGKPWVDLLPPADDHEHKKGDRCLAKKITHLNQILNQFWKRYVRLIVPTMAQYTKWSNIRKNIELGDVVVVLDDDVKSRNETPIARVIKLFPGKDGLVRKVLIKWKGKIFERPIVRLCTIFRNNSDLNKEEIAANAIIQRPDLPPADAKASRKRKRGTPNRVYIGWGNTNSFCAVQST
jgi:hypothetical protein